MEALFCEHGRRSGDNIRTIFAPHVCPISRDRTTSIGLRQSGHHSTDRHAVAPTSLRCCSALFPHTGQVVSPFRSRIATEYSLPSILRASLLIRSGVHTGDIQNRTVTSYPDARAAATTSFSMTSKAGHPMIVGTRSTRIAEFSATTSSRIPNCCLLYTSPSPRDYAASRMPSSA